MIDKTKVAIRSSTQDHLDIEDIRDDLIILKDGGSALVLKTTAINFDLLSEKEQEATIYAYAALLNSLTFTIQIVIRSQRKDISAYLELLDKTQAKETRPLIKNQIVKYRQFVAETVRKNDVLDKKFYLIIPMTSLELGIGQALGQLKPRKKELPMSPDQIIQKAKINLYPKRDHLLRQLNRLGLKTKQVRNQELIRLFFNIYNSDNDQSNVDMAEHQTTMVQPKPPTEPKKKIEKPIARPNESFTDNLPVKQEEAPALRSGFLKTEVVKPQKTQPSVNVQSQISQLVKNSTE